MSDEWAKTTGKGIDAARELGEFLAPIVKAPFENAMGIVADKLAYMRWERQQRLMMRANDFMLEQGLSQPTRAVPLNIAIPIMQAASMEEDDELQDMWARLLVNALNTDSGIEMRRSFISILEMLTPVEANILSMLYYETRTNRDMLFYTYALPETLVSKDLTVGVPPHRPSTNAVQVSVWNLARLGCVTNVNSAPRTARVILTISITNLGEALVQACTFKPKG